MKKLFIIGPSDNGEGVYNLLVEDGEFLASHLCSNANYAERDLVRPDREEKWEKKFGEYKVLWLNAQTEISIKELLKRNKEWYEANKDNAKAQKDGQPSIKITV